MRWCSHCKKEVTIEQCRTEDGSLTAMCRQCTQQRRIQETAPPQEDIIEDDNIEGVQNIQLDEFDILLESDLEEYMEIDIPEDAAMNTTEAERVTKMNEKLAELRLESCDYCNERDFDLGVRQGRCARCRRDAIHEINKFGSQNKMCPGKYLV